MRWAVPRWRNPIYQTTESEKSWDEMRNSECPTNLPNIPLMTVSLASTRQCIDYSFYTSFNSPADYSTDARN
jgi:hypothetical protein